MDLLRVDINDFDRAPFCSHNYPCPIFTDEHAVYVIGHGFLCLAGRLKSRGDILLKLKLDLRCGG